MFQLSLQLEIQYFLGYKLNFQYFWSNWSVKSGPLVQIIISVSSCCCFHLSRWASFEATSGLKGVVIASVNENVDSDCSRSTVSGKKHT